MRIKPSRCICRLLATLMMSVSVAAALDKNNAPSEYQLPRPAAKPADRSEPVKVFIMIERSSKFGLGHVSRQQGGGS